MIASVQVPWYKYYSKILPVGYDGVPGYVNGKSKLPRSSTYVVTVKVFISYVFQRGTGNKSNIIIIIIWFFQWSDTCSGIGITWPYDHVLCILVKSISSCCCYHGSCTDVSLKGEEKGKKILLNIYWNKEIKRQSSLSKSSIKTRSLLATAFIKIDIWSAPDGFGKIFFECQDLPYFNFLHFYECLIIIELEPCWFGSFPLLPWPYIRGIALRHWNPVFFKLPKHIGANITIMIYLFAITLFFFCSNSQYMLYFCV